jgi:hypothetical protein
MPVGAEVFDVCRAGRVGDAGERVRFEGRWMGGFGQRAVILTWEELREKRTSSRVTPIGRELPARLSKRHQVIWQEQ